MSLFSLSWFKSQNQKKKEELELEALRLQVQILRDKKEQFKNPPIKYIGGVDPIDEEKTPSKPYKKVKLVNNVLTIVLNDGDTLTKTEASMEDFQAVRNAQSESELFTIATPEPLLLKQREIEEEIKKAEQINSFAENLKDHPDFVQEDGSVFLVGKNGEKIPRSIPALLVEKFASLLYSTNNEDTKEEYEALKKFWLKCCLNPNAQSAEDLYAFLSHHQFKIDRHGNFYAYRRVVSKQGGNRELVDFVSNTYNKVKAVWKKNPEKYEVFQNTDGTYAFYKAKETDAIYPGTWIGNLKDLYLDLPNMQKKMFTSARTGKEDYRVGEVISMPRYEGDDNNQFSCSRGFHAASKAYDYSGFGDTPILVIINPMDVLAVPVGEVGKLRTCRWFFAMTLPEDEKYILDDEEFDTLHLGDVFEEKCNEGLLDYVKNSFAEEVKRHTFTIPTITAKSVNTIVTSLEEMSNIISKRVVPVDTEPEEYDEDESSID